MAKVKSDGHIRALELNWYVCFSFRGNQTIFGWDIANSVFDPKMKEIQKVVQKLSCEQESAAAAGVRTSTKT